MGLDISPVFQAIIDASKSSMGMDISPVFQAIIDASKSSMGNGHISCISGYN